MNIKEIFEKYQDQEYLQFKNIKNKRSSHVDLNAFLLLSELMSAKHYGCNIIASAEHDVIYFNIEPNDLENIITEEQIVELIQCGVYYDGFTESLYMFI